MMKEYAIKFRTEQQSELVSHMQFKGSDSPVVCSTFGCSNYLTLREQMAGTKCPACMQGKDSRFKHYKI